MLSGWHGRSFRHHGGILASTGALVKITAPTAIRNDTAKIDVKVKILFILLLLPGHMSPSHTGTSIPAAADSIANVSQQAVEYSVVLR
jgi:hypothetical protein